MYNIYSQIIRVKYLNINMYSYFETRIRMLKHIVAID